MIRVFKYLIFVSLFCSCQIKKNESILTGNERKFWISIQGNNSSINIEESLNNNYDLEIWSFKNVNREFKIYSFNKKIGLFESTQSDEKYINRFECINENKILLNGYKYNILKITEDTLEFKNQYHYSKLIPVDGNIPNWDSKSLETE
jgi:hypothetical protein